MKTGDRDELGRWRDGLGRPASPPRLKEPAPSSRDKWWFLPARPPQANGLGPLGQNVRLTPADQKFLKTLRISCE